MYIYLIRLIEKVDKEVNRKYVIKRIEYRMKFWEIKIFFKYYNIFYVLLKLFLSFFVIYYFKII